MGSLNSRRAKRQIPDVEKIIAFPLRGRLEIACNFGLNEVRQSPLEKANSALRTLRSALCTLHSALCTLLLFSYSLYLVTQVCRALEVELAGGVLHLDGH